MNTIQQHAINAIVKNEVIAATIVTNASDVVIEYTMPDGTRCQAKIGDADCAILKLASRSKQPPGVYEVTAK
jgi:hypothetical protein